MMSLCSELLRRLQGKTLVTAESCTGGGIGAALTGVPGSSAVYKGGVISYCDEVKARLLSINAETLAAFGAVSQETAAQMAKGVRELLKADVAVSVTGLAGPGGDEFGHPVGTVYIGYDSEVACAVREFRFAGDREEVRQQAIAAALELILEYA